MPFVADIRCENVFVSKVEMNMCYIVECLEQILEKELDADNSSYLEGSTLYNYVEDIEKKYAIWLNDKTELWCDFNDWFIDNYQETYNWEDVTKCFLEIEE